MPKKASMTDVAKLAGVSIATVSCVISGKKYVSAETAARVNAAIEQLSYSPNQIARNLKIGKTNVVVFVVPDTGNGYFSTAVEEVETFLSEKGYRLFIINTKENIEREIRQLKGLNHSIADGIILSSTADSWLQLQSHVPKDVPIILFDRIFSDSTLSTITCDSSKALESVINALVQKGHKKIGCIAGLKRLSTTQERLHTYYNTIKANGLPVEPVLIKEGAFEYAEVENATENLIDQGATAIIATNGAVSYFVRHACIDVLGKKLGHDIEIVGYVDAPNTDLMADYFATIYLPIGEASIAAGKEIIRQIESENSGSSSIRIPAVVRYRKD